MPDFTDAQWLTAAEKKTVDTQWARLLRKDFDQATWLRSKALYSFLTMYCGHIAHFDIHGFYEAQMRLPAYQQRFLAHMEDELTKLAEGYYQAYEDKQDIGASMLATLREHKARLHTMIRETYLRDLHAQRDRIDEEIDKFS